MRKVFILLLLMFYGSITSFSQNGQYDVRLNLNNYDCINQALLVDVDIRASSMESTFRIAEQNYRFSFNENAIDSVWLVEEGALSGFVTGTGGNLGFALYAPHNITGTLAGTVSYNLELAGGDGALIETEWVNVGTLGLHITDTDALLGLDWNTRAEFPPTVIGEITESTIVSVAEGMYIVDTDLDTVSEEAENFCGDDFSNAMHDIRLNLNTYDCDAQTLLVDIDVRASSVGSAFRIAEQNYRFSFNENAIDSIWIEEEGTISGHIPGTGGDLDFASYSPHNLTGTLEGEVSYNMELTSGDGVLIETEWVHVGTLGFHVPDADVLLNFDWNVQADFPPTFVSELTDFGTIIVEENEYIVDADLDNFSQTVEETCSEPEPEENGQYDVRFNLNTYDCDAQKLLVDIDVRASSADSTFRIAEQNYRFLYNTNAIDSVWIEEEGTLSNYVADTGGDQNFAFYSPHNLTGTLEGEVSYNMELSGGDGVLIETEWVNVGTLGFRISNVDALLNFDWNMQADFPPTFISEFTASEPVLVAEGTYIVDTELDNFSDAIEAICPDDTEDPCTAVAVSEPLCYINDNDFFIDGVGFANNSSITFMDNTSSANAVFSDVTLELYFRLTGSSCENEIAIQLTDPAGNTQALTAFTTCNGNTGLYYINFDVTNVQSGANDWLIEFDDTNDQNSGYEYSVRFARLKYTTTNTGGGSTPVTNEVSEFADSDLFIDGAGFENNSNYTFTDPGTPTDAVLSDITLELYFRLNGNSCENEIALQLTDPAGNTQALTAFTTCNGDNGLYYVNLDIPSGSTTGSVADWLLEFDDTNDQNAGYEYSVRFGRLIYTTVYTPPSGDGTLTTVNETISDFADTDLFIDGVGFDNNEVYTFTDSGTPADAVLSNIQLELYFRLNDNSCENEIALQLTDPAGNTQTLTAFTTCNGDNGLYYVNLDVPSGNTTGNVADWVAEFDDTNDQNSGYEYSVRFGRLTYDVEYTECVLMLANEQNNEAHQHINTSARQYINTSAHQHVSTLNIFPVPTVGQLNIEYFSNENENIFVEIIHANGAIIYSEIESVLEGENVFQLELQDLPGGIYYIKLTDNKGHIKAKPFTKLSP